MNKFSLFLAVVFFTSQVAFADTFSAGAATRCSPKAGAFEITAFVDADDENDPGSVPLKKGFSLLVDKGKHQLACKLSNSTTIKTTIHVYEADNGMCMGVGQIFIDNLTVGKTSIIKDENFNWHCPTDPVITDIKVQYVKGEVILKQCMAETWEWGQGFLNVKCKSRVIHQ